jgi:uncharacterized membrane protein YvbJ
MENKLEITCPSCKSIVPADVFFCPNCGKQLKDKPPATTAWRQIVVYSISLFVPPFGLFYAWKYIKQGDSKSKMIAIISIILTIISLIFTFWTMGDLINSINKSVNQINSLGL